MFLDEEQISRNQKILQPSIGGKNLLLKPLTTEDFEALYSVASDPLIWEQHPNPLRYKIEVFRKYFDESMQSKGSLSISDKSNGQIIGCTRYYELNLTKSEIVIGFTFISRKYWGGSFNSELKHLMVQHAFQFVNNVLFHVGEDNIRSQKALQKIGANFVREEKREIPNGNSQKKLIFEIRKP